MLAHQVDRSWQSDLVARHPHLFVSGDHQTGIPGYPLVGDGWRDLVERAVGRIADVIAAAPSARVTLVELKEKYGTLRLYWRGAGLSKPIEVAIEDAVALAEARSACSCEICGAPGVLHSRGGWLATACAAHARGEPVPIVSGFENVHIVRIFDAGHPIAACRRYDRAADKFVDVDPSIEE